MSSQASFPPQIPSLIEGDSEFAPPANSGPEMADQRDPNTPSEVGAVRSTAESGGEDEDETGTVISESETSDYEEILARRKRPRVHRQDIRQYSSPLTVVIA